MLALSDHGGLGRAFQHPRFKSGNASDALEHATRVDHYLGGVRTSEGSMIKAVLDAVVATIMPESEAAGWMDELWGRGALVHVSARSEELFPGEQLYVLELLEDLFRALEDGITAASTEAFQTKLARWLQMLGTADLEIGTKRLIDELWSAHQRYLAAEDPPAADATAAARDAATAAARKQARRATYTAANFGSLAAREQFLPPSAAEVATALIAIRAAINTNQARITARFSITRDVFFKPSTRAARQKKTMPFLSPAQYIMDCFRGQFGRPGPAEHQKLKGCWPEKKEAFLDYVPRLRAAALLNRADPSITQEVLLALLLDILRKSHFSGLYGRADTIYTGLPEPRTLEGLLVPLCEYVKDHERLEETLSTLGPFQAPPSRSHSPDPRSRLPTRTSHTSHPRASSSPPSSRRADTPTRSPARQVTWAANSSSPQVPRSSSPTAYIDAQAFCTICRVQHPEGFCPARSAGSKYLPPSWFPTTQAQFKAFSMDVANKRLDDFRSIQPPSAVSTSLQHHPPATSSRPLLQPSQHVRPLPSTVNRPRDTRTTQVVPTTANRHQQSTPSSTPNYKAMPPPQSYNAHFSHSRHDPPPRYHDEDPDIFGAHSTELSTSAPHAASPSPRRSPRTRAQAVQFSPAPVATAPPPPPPARAAAPSSPASSPSSPAMAAAPSSPAPPSPAPAAVRQFAVPRVPTPAPFAVTELPAGLSPAALPPTSFPRGGTSQGASGPLAAPASGGLMARPPTSQPQLAARVYRASDPRVCPQDEPYVEVTLGDVFRSVASGGLRSYLPALLSSPAPFIISGVGAERYATSSERGHLMVRLPFDALAELPAPAGPVGGRAVFPSRAPEVNAGGGGQQRASALRAEVWAREESSPPSSLGDRCLYADDEGHLRPSDGPLSGWQGPAPADAEPQRDCWAEAEDFYDSPRHDTTDEDLGGGFMGGGPLAGGELRAELDQEAEPYANGGPEARQEAMIWEANRHAEALAQEAELRAQEEAAAEAASLHPHLQPLHLRAQEAAAPPSSTDPWDLFSDEDPPTPPSSPPPYTAAFSVDNHQSSFTTPSPPTERVYKAPSITLLPANSPASGISIIVEGQLLADSHPATLCDSGANVNLIPLQWAERLGLQWSADGQVALYSTAPGPRPTLGKVITPVKIRLAHGTKSSVTFDLPLHVVDTGRAQSWGLLLGTGWLGAIGASIDFFESRLYFRPRLHKVATDKPLTSKTRSYLRACSVPLITTTDNPHPTFLADLLSPCGIPSC